MIVIIYAVVLLVSIPLGALIKSLNGNKASLSDLDTSLEDVVVQSTKYG